jgi:Asp-tRNA(Asn)/Glu-tRNA(Gln) amidotransferase A subunit family amidase
MALSWSMDKIGPICRTAEDCALVLNVIYGPDGKDSTVADMPFHWDSDAAITDLKVGYLKSAFEADHDGKDLDNQALDVLRSLGVELIPISLPDYPVEALMLILVAEAGAAFDELTRSNRDDLLMRQNKDSWPNTFRKSRMIPAVEYIQANRIRTLIMREMAVVMDSIDVFVAPSFADKLLMMTNLTGHPAVVVPDGVTEDGKPGSLTFTGKLYGESAALLAAKAYQEATDFHRRQPSINPIENEQTL